MLGASVPREKAEELRRMLAHQYLVDKRRAIVEEGHRIVIPLVSVPDPVLLERFNASLTDRDFCQRDSFVDPIDEIRAMASIPVELKSRLPGKWELLGNVAVLKLGPGLDEYESEIARAYSSVLGVKSVLREIGPISGEYRKPTMKVLLGSDTVTVHVENRILFKLDASDIMFSSGNQEERLRMAGLRCDNETVVDMFAGIGYFSLPLAVYQKPRQVIACEINPKAYGYLVENVKMNRVESIVKPVLGDNRDLQGETIADRVIMGYVKTTHEFLPKALRLLKDGGTIHYHETCPNQLLPERPLQRLLDAARPGTVRVLRTKAIKSYAPGVSHVVLDARVLKSS